MYGLLQIQVGDVLCVEDDDELPCDLLLLSTSSANGKASVLTANLDGETNLKVGGERCWVQTRAGFDFNSDRFCPNFSATI